MLLVVLTLPPVSACEVRGFKRLWNVTAAYDATPPTSSKNGLAKCTLLGPYFNLSKPYSTLPKVIILRLFRLFRRACGFLPEQHPSAPIGAHSA